MLPILNLANLYSEDKIADKYPCYKEGVPLLENLFYEFLDSVRFIDDFYDLLADNYYLANETLFLWQNENAIPTDDNAFSDFFGNQVALEENIYWKSDCSAEETTKILHDLIPLWSSLLAHKIANEDMSREDFDTFLDDMYSYMQSKENAILRYPYKVSFHKDHQNHTTAIEYTDEPNEEDIAPKKRKKSLAPILVMFLLLVAGIWFFRSGTYQKMTKPVEKDTFYNVVIDSSSTDSLMLRSTQRDTQLYISPQAMPYLDQIYLQDSLRLSTIDSLPVIRPLLALSELDSNLSYDIGMNKKNQEILQKEYPELVYNYVPIDKDSTFITITLKHK